MTHDKPRYDGFELTTEGDNPMDDRNTMGMTREPTPEFWALCGTMGQGWPGEGPGASHERFLPNPLNTARGIRCVSGERGRFQVKDSDG